MVGKEVYALSFIQEMHLVSQVELEGSNKDGLTCTKAQTT